MTDEIAADIVQAQEAMGRLRRRYDDAAAYSRAFESTLKRVLAVCSDPAVDAQVKVNLVSGLVVGRLDEVEKDRRKT